MAKGGRGRRRISSRQCKTTPHSLSACNHHGISKDLLPRRCSKVPDKKDWEDARCAVCMECPHNAVLLLCSSHDKGCRAYMCGTSFRYSNCLDQYKKAYTKVVASNHRQPENGTLGNPIDLSDLNLMDVDNTTNNNCVVPELACPLCRGQVKGWTVVEPAREYLNSKKRSCMQDDCSFLGTFKELRKHMKADHPSARPREVDPDMEQKWRSLERERERNDVLSTIRSTMPGARVFGDYVIEGNRHHEFHSDEDGGGFEGNGVDADLMNFFILFHAFGHSGDELRRRLRNPQGNIGIRHPSPVGGLNVQEQVYDDDDDDDLDDPDDGHSFESRMRLRHNQELLGRSARRRRRREANNRDQN
ncbi:uncharacterized protein [Rutidosis leptorrhynchoides]|uniref:uncharacterized protein n=1 Tax=Rutidosis leptorrhynchoides TaxID=125765 RepID=UPI003A991AE1